MKRDPASVPLSFWKATLAVAVGILIAASVIAASAFVYKAVSAMQAEREADRAKEEEDRLLMGCLDSAGKEGLTTIEAFRRCMPSVFR